jgi:hypothetical protein
MIDRPIAEAGGASGPDAAGVNYKRKSEIVLTTLPRNSM